jgi:hypothetical protein
MMPEEARVGGGRPPIAPPGYCHPFWFVDFVPACFGDSGVGDFARFHHDVTVS